MAGGLVNRSTLALAIALGVGVIVAPTVALAQNPTPAQIEKAKKAFFAGKKAFDAGDFPEAIVKFKESYNLSKNPVLLYNIAFANDQAGMEDIALFYYRKFLTDAPEDAAQRAEVVARVGVLEKKFLGGGTTTTTTPEPTKPEPTRTEPVKIKPAGTYSADDFQHQTVDVAPPKKPLDVTAFVPEDSGFKVTLNFRTAGEGKFTSKEMRWRYKELVARIPPEKMLGDMVQYYIEVKDAAGQVVTRAGKSTSPNLITLEAGATPRFYPDFTEDGDTTPTTAETHAGDTDEDPLTGKKKNPKPDPGDIDLNPQPTEAGNGFRDVGSSKFKYMKWGSTATAGAAIGLSVTFYILAGKQATSLENDSLMCGAPPCRMYDQYNRDLQAAGKRNQSIHRVALGVGVAAAAVAGYYWYKELTAKKRGELKVSGKPAAPETSWSVVPSLGGVDDKAFVGAAAATRF